MMDREPPFSTQAELAVLGSVIADPESLPAVLEIVRAKDFYHEAHRRTFAAMQAIWEQGDKIDPIVVCDRLKSTDELEYVGGMGFVSALIDYVPNTDAAERHARIVADCATLRRLVDACQGTLTDVYSPEGRAVSEIVGEAESRLLGVMDGKSGGYTWIKETLWETLDQIENQQGEDLPGISWGIPELDRMTLGLHKGDLTIVAARPSMGKSALAFGVAANAAITEQTGVLIVSYEMPERQITMRLLGMEGRVDLQAIRRGNLTTEDHARMGNAAGHLNTAPIFMDDGFDVSLTTLLAKSRRAVKSDNVGLVVVDYIQLMSAPGENRTLQIGAISGGLKRLARQCDIPVLALSQLSRGVDSRTDKRPMLSDLRQSGDIEQDADNVLFVYRPEYYLSDEQKRGGMLEGVAELIVAKQRNGPTGSVPAVFHKSYARFEGA